ncbi:hypothetical protein [uncultured Bradyrhizobium sp.]|jgi:hypothetical protein|uniref:hypothetical protein n=1 Tax=uncultured Bradyrhizobium sp. TaxID=199684 RepID=UPI0026255BBE|nr:hypothetical protein [uncultured Bradyrhizobium sp.]
MRDPYFEFERALLLVFSDDLDPEKRMILRRNLARTRVNVDVTHPRYAEAVAKAMEVLPSVDQRGFAGI